MHKLALLLSLLLILAHTEGVAFLSKWLLSPMGRRQNPGSLWQCPALPPDMNYCSYSASSPESIQEANVWIALLSSRCHPHAMKFVCTVYNPVCLHSHQVMPILPCREFCIEVRSACVSRMYLFGFKWPQQVDCDRFPSEEASMCISSKRESVTCSPCTQETSRDNIVRKYCQADVVIKSQISGVTAFGNTSSLLVKLDRVSEQLLPQPPIHSPGNLKPNGFLAPSTGFVDTNDERILLLSQTRRLKHEYNMDNQVTDMMAYDQPADFLFTTPASKSLLLPATESDDTKGVTEHSKSERRKRRREERLQGRLSKRRRRNKRSSLIQVPHATETSSSQSMLLECAGCSLQLPISPMAPNSATRWLVMAKKLDNSRLNLTNTSPMLQITSLMAWQKDSPGFRDALHDIRTIPRTILCNPNTKVELNLDGFHHIETTTPLPTPFRQSVRTSWSRQGWVTQSRQPAPPWNLPAPLESLFQNDAAVGNRKTKRQQRQMRKQRNQFGQRQIGDSVKVRAKPKNEEEKERRRRRRKARKERLARMPPQQRAAWLTQRRARRAQKQLKGRQMLQHQASCTDVHTRSHQHMQTCYVDRLVIE
ncbi:Secreted frizzled-related protein 2 [Echinococcus granulosus]|uniref:Secreted frizzled protein 5 n=1 Tax=Echinococcus granulosus TaxID=6210 RepID=A0A068WG98_ECHGR|nr:Secreted frizzled-related protein 2 [Echinococcus granulosus]CDS17471.1 secreted frizzled protein 5 [Echinococcus granulosus]